MNNRNRRGMRILWEWFLPAAAGLLLLALLPSLRAEAAPAASQRKVVFIGDSRTVGMYMAVTGNGASESLHKTDRAGDVWSAKVGEGLWWARRTGVPQVEKEIDANTDVVLTLGLNDQGMNDFASEYTSYFNKKAAAWANLGARTYFVSILPVRRDHSAITNRNITKSNEALLEGFSDDITYIDLYTPFAGKISYEDNDHFQPSSYTAAYTYIKLVLQLQNSSSVDGFCRCQ